MIEVMLKLLLLCTECCVLQSISMSDTMGKDIFSVTHNKMFCVGHNETSLSVRRLLSVVHKW